MEGVSERDCARRERRSPHPQSKLSLTASAVSVSIASWGGMSSVVPAAWAAPPPPGGGGAAAAPSAAIAFFPSFSRCADDASQISFHSLP
jgi:hypothetical protein